MLSCVTLLYVRIVVIGGGVPKTFVESDNPIVFHSDQWTRFRTYIYLCVFNTWLLLCPSTLCYDWSMDSIPRIERLWDARNAASCCFVMMLALLLWKGKNVTMYICSQHTHYMHHAFYSTQLIRIASIQCNMFLYLFTVAHIARSTHYSLRAQTDVHA